MSLIGEALEVGDKVVIVIPKDNREWGFNPCPDNTVGTVVGFSEIPYGRTGLGAYAPGIYENRAWVQLRLDGKSEPIFLGAWCLASAIDAEKYERRKTEHYEKMRSLDDRSLRSEFLRPLPETKFWEDDRVRVSGRFGDFTVAMIHYGDIGRTTANGSPWPFYEVLSVGEGYRVGATEEQLTLVNRGNVWNFYHDEPLWFPNLQEEASFFQRIGRYTEVRNRNTDNYAWTKDEALAAIASGDAHGFTMGAGFFGSGPYISVIRFDDEDLGARVAVATLEGFKVK